MSDELTAAFDRGNSAATRLDEIVQELNALAGPADEQPHMEADDLLEEALTILGRQDIVDAYRKIGKWYA